jgi:hypothetical protein
MKSLWKNGWATYLVMEVVGKPIEAERLKVHHQALEGVPLGLLE